MKVDITEKGVYSQDGTRVPVGTEINVKGDEVPAWLVNKGRVIVEKTAKAVAVTNPAQGATQEPAKKGD
jgi:hypothetical protein